MNGSTHILREQTKSFWALSILLLNSLCRLHGESYGHDRNVRSAMQHSVRCIAQKSLWAGKKSYIVLSYPVRHPVNTMLYAPGFLASTGTLLVTLVTIACIKSSRARSATWGCLAYTGHACYAAGASLWDWLSNAELETLKHEHASMAQRQANFDEHVAGIREEIARVNTTMAARDGTIDDIQRRMSIVQEVQESARNDTARRLDALHGELGTMGSKQQELAERILHGQQTLDELTLAMQHVQEELAACQKNLGSKITATHEELHARHDALTQQLDQAHKETRLLGCMAIRSFTCLGKKIDARYTQLFGAFHTEMAPLVDAQAGMLHILTDTREGVLFLLQHTPKQQLALTMQHVQNPH